MARKETANEERKKRIIGKLGNSSHVSKQFVTRLPRVTNPEERLPGRLIRYGFHRPEGRGKRLLWPLFSKSAILSGVSIIS